jgi:hypothetical protein
MTYLSRSRSYFIAAGAFAFALGACSSADDDGNSDGNSDGNDSGGMTAGGSSAGGGAGVTAGGTGGTTGGAGTGASGGEPGTGGTGGGPVCTGISNGAPCTPEGGVCEDLICGLLDTGSRSCTCTAAGWDCLRCAFPPEVEIVQEPAEALPLCEGVVEDAPCTEAPYLCRLTEADDTDVCGCYEDYVNNSSGATIWDCDSPPNTWATCADGAAWCG